MKKLLSIFLAALMLLAAAAYAEEDGVEIAYSDIISVYAVAAREGWDREKLEENGLNYMLCDCDRYGFIIDDFDGDGTPELAIAADTDDEFFRGMIFDFYCVQGGSVVRLFSSGERDRYTYAGGALFTHVGSSGADDSFDTTVEYALGTLTDRGISTSVDDPVQLALEPLGAGPEIPNVGIANPWREVTAEEMLEEIGIAFTLPENTASARYSMIADAELAQVEFTLSDYDMIFTARMQPAAEYEDISGLYYDWDAVVQCNIGGCPGESKRAIGEEETVDLCMWYDVVPGMMYSVSTSDTDLDGFDIEAIAIQLYTPLQGND